MTRLAPFLFVLLAFFALPVSAQTYLYMAEEDGCQWCERWNEEISHIYPKTSEGQAAPLKRFDLHDEMPDVEFKTRVSFTPTFILVDDNKEIGRIEGYPGEDFFWGLLGMMLERAEIPFEKAE